MATCYLAQTAVPVGSNVLVTPPGKQLRSGRSHCLGAAMPRRRYNPGTRAGANSDTPRRPVTCNNQFRHIGQFRSRRKRHRCSIADRLFGGKPVEARRFRALVRSPNPSAASQSSPAETAAVIITHCECRCILSMGISGSQQGQTIRGSQSCCFRVKTLFCRPRHLLEEDQRVVDGVVCAIMSV